MVYVKGIFSRQPKRSTYVWATLVKKVTKIYQKSQNLVTLSLWNERICCKCDRIWAICESYLFHIFFPKKTFYLFGHYFLNRLWDNVLLAMVLTITTLYLPTYISTYPRVVIYERKLFYKIGHTWPEQFLCLLRLRFLYFKRHL